MSPRKFKEKELNPEYFCGGALVWCQAGATEVLRKKAFHNWLREKPVKPYMIIFANGASVRGLTPGNELWKAMAKLAGEHEVKVFPLSLYAKDYIPWTGAPDSPTSFDAISISPKAAVEKAA